MFGNRQRKPRDVKANPTFLAPKQEANTTYSSPGPAISSRLNVEIEDPQTVVPPQVTEIMSIIKLNWDFMTSTEFSAIPYSLSLSDPSSVGSDYQRFLDTFAMVDEAMDLVVNDYYDVFNTSIGRFSQVIDVIRDSQKKETELEGMLKMSKEELECQKYDFLHLWVKHLQYKEMAKILDLVAEVQGLVDSLEPLVIDKEYVQVVLKIRAAEKMLQNNVLSEIGALSILKEKIEKIKQYLRENLTEELIRIVYLTDDYTRMQEKIDAPDVSQLIFDKSAGLENLGFNKEMEIVEPYYHMQEIIEVLYHLGELDNSLQTVKDRITVDTYNVVSQVIQEVEEEFPSCSDKNVYIDDGDDSPQDHVIIYRLLYLLYERMFAVVEGHLFIFKCLEAIHTEFNVEKAMIYSKREVAAVIQNEVKALLYDYLSGGAVDNSQNGTSIVALTEMLKDTSKEKLKLSKQLFYIKQQPDDVYTRELKLQCGYQIDIALVAESPSSEGMQLDHIMLESFVTAIQSGHKMLVPPAVSHILVCFEPTVLFMRQLEQKIGMNLVNFNVFLTDFIMNIYLPNIQEQILVYHHSNIHGIDAFQAEKCPAADYPLIKSALCMVLATHGICRLTKMMPIHSEELIRVLIQLLGKYYQYCVRRLNSLRI